MMHELGSALLLPLMVVVGLVINYLRSRTALVKPSKRMPL